MTDYIDTVSKEAAYSPALLADDAMDFYMQYTAAKRSLDAKKSRQQVRAKRTAYNDVAKQKTAGFEEYLEPVVSKILDNPRMFIPSAKTVGLVGTGVAASMYGPEWAYGPNEEEIAKGKRFSAKRALKGAFTTGILGSSVLSIPSATHRLATSESLGQKLLHGSQLAIGATVAGSVLGPIARGKDPDLKKTLKHYRVANMLATPAQVYGVLSSSPEFMDAVRNAFEAANAPTQSSAASTGIIPYRGC